MGSDISLALIVTSGRPGNQHLSAALQLIAAEAGRAQLASLDTVLNQNASLMREFSAQLAIRHALDTSAIHRAAQQALASVAPPDWSVPLRELARTSASLNQALSALPPRHFRELQAAIQQQLASLPALQISIPEYLKSTGTSAPDLAGQLSALARTIAVQSQLSLPSGILADLERSLEERFASEASPGAPTDNLLAATLDASQAAAENAGTSFDWKTWLQIVLTLLIFLVQRQESQQSEKRLGAATDSLHLSIARQDSTLVSLLHTVGWPAVVVHLTYLRDRPWANSTVRRRLPPGSAVTVLQRRRRWSFVMVPADSSTPSIVAGWILNKYLERE